MYKLCGTPKEMSSPLLQVPQAWNAQGSFRKHEKLNKLRLGEALTFKTTSEVDGDTSEQPRTTSISEVIKCCGWATAVERRRWGKKITSQCEPKLQHSHQPLFLLVWMSPWRGVLVDPPPAGRERMVCWLRFGRCEERVSRRWLATCSQCHLLQLFGKVNVYRESSQRQRAAAGKYAELSRGELAKMGKKKNKDKTIRLPAKIPQLQKTNFSPKKMIYIIQCHGFSAFGN